VNALKQPLSKFVNGLLTSFVPLVFSNSMLAW
jgi:hypothetical protein